MERVHEGVDGVGYGARGRLAAAGLAAQQQQRRGLAQRRAREAVLAQLQPAKCKSLLRVGDCMITMNSLILQALQNITCCRIKSKYGTREDRTYIRTILVSAISTEDPLRK